MAATANRLQHLLGDRRIGIVLPDLLQFGQGGVVALLRQMGFGVPVERIVGQQRILFGALQPFFGVGVTPAGIVIEAQRQRRARIEPGGRFLQRQCAQRGIGRSGVFLFELCGELFELLLRPRRTGSQPLPAWLFAVGVSPEARAYVSFVVRARAEDTRRAVFRRREPAGALRSSRLP